MAAWLSITLFASAETTWAAARAAWLAAYRERKGRGEGRWWGGGVGDTGGGAGEEGTRMRPLSDIEA